MNMRCIFVELFHNLKTKINMRNFSRQLDCFISSKPFASSHCRANDSRTYVSYYIDERGLVHSSSFNYSLIGCNPVSVDKFMELVNSDTKAMVSFT